MRNFRMDSHISQPVIEIHHNCITQTIPHSQKNYWQEYRGVEEMAQMSHHQAKFLRHVPVGRTICELNRVRTALIFENNHEPDDPKQANASPASFPCAEG